MTESSSTDFRNRVMLYGITAILLACLFVIGFVVPKFARPEPGTMLGMVELHLGMAEVIPATDKHGKKVPFKEDHLRQAEEILDELEDEAPGLGITSEYRAFASWIRGDYKNAKTHYLEALSRYEGNEELSNKTLINLAQVELAIKAGSKDTASVEAFLDRVPVKQRNADWYGIAAKAYHRKNEPAKRTEALSRAVAIAGKDRKSLEHIAEIAYYTGDSTALSTYQKIDPKSAGVWYRIANLEFKAGKIDKTLEALESCRKRNSNLLVQMLGQDKALLGDSKIQEFLKRAKAAEKEREKSNGKTAAVPGPQPGK